MYELNQKAMNRYEMMLAEILAVWGRTYQNKLRTLSDIFTITSSVYRAVYACACSVVSDSLQPHRL